MTCIFNQFRVFSYTQAFHLKRGSGEMSGDKRIHSLEICQRAILIAAELAYNVRFGDHGADTRPSPKEWQIEYIEELLNEAERELDMSKSLREILKAKEDHFELLGM